MYSQQFRPNLPKPAGVAAGGGYSGLGFDIDLLKIIPGAQSAADTVLGKVKSEAGKGAEEVVKPMVTTSIVVSLVAAGVAAAALITMVVIASRSKK